MNNIEERLAVIKKDMQKRSDEMLTRIQKRIDSIDCLLNKIEGREGVTPHQTTNYGFAESNQRVNLGHNDRSTGQNIIANNPRRKARKRPPVLQESKCAVRLDVRLVAEPDFPYTREILNTPYSVYRFARSIWDLDAECLLLLHLDNACRLNCIQRFTGTINEAPLHIREVIKTSLLSAAANIIMVHNHPSGSLEFSKEDKRATRGLLGAAVLMGISVLDHVLIAGGEYLSMKDTSSDVFFNHA